MTVNKKLFMLMPLFALLFQAGCLEDAGGFLNPPPTYSLTTNASPVTGGGVVRNPDNRVYETGTTVTLTAEPNAGYTFTGWTGVPAGVNATSSEVTIIMTRDLSVIAYFEAIPANTVIYNGNGNTGGTVPVDVNSPYSNRSTVTVLGQGDLVRADHVFGGWNTAADGSGVNYSADAVFSITGNVTLYARWIHNASVTYSVTISGGGVGASGGGRYAEGAVVEISAGTMSGKRFVNWTATGHNVIFDDASSAVTSFIMPASDVTVTANFEIAPTYEVTVISVGSGASGSGSYAEGATVTVNAGSPLASQRFVGWTVTSGGVTLTNTNSVRASFRMPANDVTVTANFEWFGADPYYLGYGYDVINSSYIFEGDVKRLHPVLNQRRMISDNITVSERIAGTQEFEVFTGNTLREFYEARNEGVRLGVSADIPIKPVLFSGKYEREFGSQTIQNGIDRHSYSRGRTYRHTLREYIGHGNARAEILKDYLTDGFAADLRSGDVGLILDRYGSHVFVQYYKGGAMEFSYAYHGTELTTVEQLKNAVSASLGLKIAGFGLGVSGGQQEQTEERRIELENNSMFQSRTYGGIAINISSVDAILSNYENWVRSIESNADICGIAGFDDSFMSVWELAEAVGEFELARRLEGEFIRRVTERSDNLWTRRPAVGQIVVEFNDVGTHPFSYNGTFPATVEIYALGAGGGGQGGHRKEWPFGQHQYGTGGGGGGGAAAYTKITIERSTDFTVTIGGGGSGGTHRNIDWGTNWYSGDAGDNGGSTTVRWESATLTVSGGTGGGGEGQSIIGGIGGDGSLANRPLNSLDWVVASGRNGTNGNSDRHTGGSGGSSAGIIGKGTLPSFGGGGWGSGGGAGYSTNNGSDGGNGHVVIVVTYYEVD